jgi:DNA-binding transcriptional MocR family regulator
MRRLYGQRRTVMLEVLHERLAGKFTISGEAAGIFMLIRFRSKAIPERAKQRNVLMASTRRFYISNPPMNEFILRFAGIGEGAIREGIERLA